MSSTHFKVGGALTSVDADVYIERLADQAALTHLRAMEYLLIIEPRQQGKTSLANCLMRNPALTTAIFAYADLTTLDNSSEAAWYRTLIERILQQLKFIPRNQWPPTSKNGFEWRGFLSEVANLALIDQRQVIVTLDEIGAINFTGATQFFSVLRDVFNSRQAEGEFNQITFILAGAFHPRDLIADERISPFNIAQRVRLRDFEQSQTDELVFRLNLGHHLETVQELADRLRKVSNRIFYWTDGQPYLTQWLCRYLASRGPHISSNDVDTGVEYLQREDENHLPSMLEKLVVDEALRDYLLKIRNGESIKFYPAQNRRQAQLELLGAIKADEHGFCRIRNRIYEQAFQRLASEYATDQSSAVIIAKTEPSTSTDYQAILGKYAGKRILANLSGEPPQFFVYQNQLCHLAPEAARLLDEIGVGHDRLVPEDEIVLGLSGLRGPTIGSRAHMEGILREVRPELFSLQLTHQNQGPKYVIYVPQGNGTIIGDGMHVRQNFGTSAASDRHLADIANEINVGFDELKQGQAAIHKQIGQVHQEQLSRILNLVQAGRLEQGEVERTLDAIRRTLRAMQSGDIKLSDQVSELVSQLQQQSGVESKLGLQQKLELALPIIPMFLDYKVELVAGSEIDLASLRAELAERWQALITKAR